MSKSSKGSRPPKKFNQKPRGGMRRHKGVGGKGVILDLKKRTQARQLREQQKKVAQAEIPSDEAATDAVNMTANLLVTVFQEEDINPYAAMGGRGVLLCRMAYKDGNSREEFLERMSAVYDHVVEIEKKIEKEPS